MDLKIVYGSENYTGEAELLFKSNWYLYAIAK